ncbi:MAG: hypothetical protein QW584_03585 [Thermofilaceae archaeon]
MLLKEILLKKLETELLNDYIDIALTKKELLDMSKEEIDLIRNSTINGYNSLQVRNVKPKSFDDFLENEKYGKDYVVHFTISLRDLIERNVLSVAEENGKSYWYLYGEKLDPKSYAKLYTRDQKTFKTLIEEFNLNEIAGKFIVEPSQREDSILKITTQKYTYYIGCKEKCAELYLDLNTTYEEFSEYLNIKYPVSITFTTDNPRVEDIVAIEELVERIKLDMNTKVNKIIEWLKNSLESFSAKEVKLFGRVLIMKRPYDEYFFEIEIERIVDDSSSLKITISYNVPIDFDAYLKQFHENKDIMYIAKRSPYLYTELRYDIKSALLIHVLKKIPSIEDIAPRENGYDLFIDKDTNVFSYRFSENYDIDFDLNNLPDISAIESSILGIRKRLRELIADYLNEKKKEKVTIYTLASSVELDKTVDDLIKLVDWRDNQSIDEAILKIWLLNSYLSSYSNMIGVDPNIIPILIVLTYLDHGSHRYTLHNLESGLEHAINLSLRGRLRIRESGVYLDGKRIDIDLAKDQYMKSLIEIIALSSSNIEREGEQSEIKQRMIHY